MKILIWIGCSFVYGLIVTTLSYMGVSLGGVPIFLLAGLMMWTSSALCKRIENKPIPGIDWAKVKAFFRRYEAPWPIVLFLLLVLILSFIQIQSMSLQIEELEYQVDELLGQYELGYDKGYFEGYDEGYGEACIKLEDDSSYEDGYKLGLNDGHSNGYREGYYIGYGCAVVDYADEKTQAEFLLNELAYSKSHNDESWDYDDLYQWIILRRQTIFGR